MVIRYSVTAEKQLSKLNKTIQRNIRKYMDEVSELDAREAEGTSCMVT